MNTSRLQNRPSKPCRRSIRIKFCYEKNTIRLVGFQRVQATCPPAVGPLPDPEAASGLWVEIRDSKGELLHYRLLHGHFTSAETTREDGTLERYFADEVVCDFYVLLPDLENACHIVFMGDIGKKSKKAKKGQRSSELARFDIPTGSQGEFE